ncbi:hypothetical protein Tsubulata_028861 [Turnera subulata]|uniref:FAD-binding PCMH-type domain-containing protein n=1 Tax=Turnera subulata TaxID=218843 RepID=A0A9Q0JFJ7_9ROSI|nr:hypothetical protein Tsubulata_028861 [Turnera subulata]
MIRSALGYLVALDGYPRRFHLPEIVGCLIRTRSGGHDYEGLSYTSDVPFVILDVNPLRSIKIDIENETAWVEAGATLGELYYNIAHKSKVHAFPAGVCATLGTGGHFSGGGYGNLMRKYGLSVDNIVDALMVDANGEILNRETMGEDLFWAIRGGGGASFGVILAWKIALVRVPEKVTVFRIGRTLEEGATDVVYWWQHIAPHLDRNLFIRVMPVVVNSTQTNKKTIKVSFIGLFLGRTGRLLSLMAKSFPQLNQQRNDCREVSWLVSTLLWANLPESDAGILLERPSGPRNFFKSKSDFVNEAIPKEGLESIWEMMLRNGNLWMQWNPYGGRMSEIASNATAYPHRAGYLFKIQYYAGWEDDRIDAKAKLRSARVFYAGMAPHVTKNPRLAFQNYRDLDIGRNPSNRTNIKKAKVYGEKYFKDNFLRLTQVKARVDPGNFFRHEQSIPPFHEKFACLRA